MRALAVVAVIAGVILLLWAFRSDSLALGATGMVSLLAGLVKLVEFTTGQRDLRSLWLWLRGARESEQPPGGPTQAEPILPDSARADSDKSTSPTETGPAPVDVQAAPVSSLTTREPVSAILNGTQTQEVLPADQRYGVKLVPGDRREYVVHDPRDKTRWVELKLSLFRADPSSVFVHVCSPKGGSAGDAICTWEASNVEPGSHEVLTASGAMAEVVLQDYLVAMGDDPDRPRKVFRWVEIAFEVVFVDAV